MPRSTGVDRQATSGEVATYAAAIGRLATDLGVSGLRFVATAASKRPQVRTGCISLGKCCSRPSCAGPTRKRRRATTRRTGCCFLPSRTRSACSRYRRDPYRFSLTATTTLQSSHGSGVKSFLVRDVTTGAITSYSYASRQLTLAAGDWELEVGNQSAGTYCLTLSRT